ncbi:MAG TPA: glutamine--fructose-6-phosphate transaminase (isomerizing) [Halanaerobiales bacterium]|nr:glutamine--fructose-6-phosphate transaminase (isomerizing) [Halanaerobiales bacterium]
MCGIVGYVGEKKAASILYDGLKRLEYRGYDSSGIAVNDGLNIDVVKKKGKLEQLKKNIKGNVNGGTTGIGHTRWATHGQPSDINSHPHSDCKDNFVIAHNGIIENFQNIKKYLKKEGHIFKSETDTEVIAHLLEDYYEGDILKALKKTIERLEGSYALTILSKHDPDKIYVARKDSPLIIGIGEDENYIASDIPAFLGETRDFYILEDGEFAVINKDEIDIFDFNLAPKEKEVYHVDWDPEMAEKQGYDHFMLKEIHEQPDAVRRLMANRVTPEGINLAELNLDKEFLNNLNQVHLIACGTAYHSCLIGKYMMEDLSELSVEVDVASEYRYRNVPIKENDLVIAVSQSGETSDTLASLRLAKEKGAKVLAFTNSRGSSIAREADEVMLLKAGPEISVASTKAYLNMVVAFYMFSLFLADKQNKIANNRYLEMSKDLIKLPDLLDDVIEKSERVMKDRADQYANSENAFFIGRHTDYTLAMEGALKLKEISYIHAEAYPAGELKHGTLALIEEGVPVVALGTRETVFEKTLSNITEVKARGGDVTAIVHKDAKDIEDVVDHIVYIPEVNELFTGALAIVPLQLLAYYTALLRGCDIDQPRNLAKSVTVE